MSDQEVIDYMNLNYPKRSKRWDKLPQEIKTYLENRYGEFNGDYSEIYYRITHNIDEIPVCPVCGTKRNYIDTCKGYGSPYCSMKCQWTTRKRKQPSLYKYQKPVTINGKTYTSYTELNDELVLLYVDSELQKQSKIIWNKLEYPIAEYLDKRFNDSQSRKESWYRIKHHIEIRPVCVMCGKPVSFNGREGLRLGFGRHCSSNVCVMNDPETLRKVRENSKIKWGTYYPLQSEKVRLKGINKNTNVPTWSSKQEIEFRDRLKQIYPDLKWQYKDKERYPYFCDFYIPTLDLFIELNYYWKHGGEEFDKNNPEHVQRLNTYMEKAKYDDEYKTAIETWTLSDKEKILCAINNKLNYKIFWNKEEGDAWLDSIGA